MYDKITIIRHAQMRRKDHKMADNKNIEKDVEVTEEEALVITLTDEDGKEIEFEVIGDAEIDGTVYYAMMPTDNASAEEDVFEYVLLKKVEEDGEDMFVTLDDEEEFEKVANFFDEMFDSEVDYDN